MLRVIFLDCLKSWVIIGVIFVLPLVWILGSRDTCLSCQNFTWVFLNIPLERPEVFNLIHTFFAQITVIIREQRWFLFQHVFLIVICHFIKYFLGFSYNTGFFVLRRSKCLILHSRGHIFMNMHTLSSLTPLLSYLVVWNDRIRDRHNLILGGTIVSDISRGCYRPPLVLVFPSYNLIFPTILVLYNFIFVLLKFIDVFENEIRSFGHLRWTGLFAGSFRRIHVASSLSIDLSVVFILFLFILRIVCFVYVFAVLRYFNYNLFFVKSVIS
jgi:hypothetical protein